VLACYQAPTRASARALVGHRRAIRTTNLLKRIFLDERRRRNIIPDSVGETAVLKRMFGAVIRVAERWRSINVAEFEHGLTKPSSSDAQRAKISSGSRTRPTSGGRPLWLAAISSFMLGYANLSGSWMEP